ncbi:GIY-YIG nuclease family protein [Patescibacteria group bacterium]|nr:GIY-YIG nuclease family protein [Patescibacteria group bacterium]MBU1895394.1 GIY-YIG nuclease family protein [Patescibacteria group bacterium]
MYYVYILKCSDDKIYIGCTHNLKNRLKRHTTKQVLYTSQRLPVLLKFYCCVPNKYIAYNFERYLKSGSGRAFIKKHLI